MTELSKTRIQELAVEHYARVIRNRRSNGPPIWFVWENQEGPRKLTLDEFLAKPMGPFRKNGPILREVMRLWMMNTVDGRAFKETLNSTTREMLT
jgi:hypothetical protein